jgi:hypothetical protein
MVKKEKKKKITDTKVQKKKKKWVLLIVVLRVVFGFLPHWLLYCIGLVCRFETFAT